MKQARRRQLLGICSRALLACLALLLGWPSAAVADVGRCADLSDLAERGLSAFMVSTSGEVASKPETDAMPEETPASTEVKTPCTDGLPDDASSNFCFEDADGQISTLPTLLAQWRGEQMADAVVDSVAGTLDREDDKLVAETTALAEHIPEPVDSESCGERPDQCRSLPPLPPTLVVDASAPAARHDFEHFELSARLHDNDARAWAKLRVRPTPGHLTPPEHPPRA